MELLKDILKKTPQARGRLLVDLINEPDGYSLTWDVSSIYLYVVNDMAWQIYMLFPGVVQTMQVAWHKSIAQNSMCVGSVLQLSLTGADKQALHMPDCTRLLQIERVPCAGQQRLPCYDRPVPVRSPTDLGCLQRLHPPD